MTPSCRSCGTPVVPGHTGHDAPIDNGEETWWCDQCCPCERGDDVKQTIEVEVGPEDEDRGVPLTSPDGVTIYYAREWVVEKFGLTVPDPAPERTEYALYRLGKNGHHVTADEVLVAAHSLRVGDRIEWAPGDWREITKVEVVDTEHSIHHFHVGDQQATYRGWDLLAVRR